MTNAGNRLRGGPVSLRTTAARTVGGMISVIRVPADTTLWLVGRAPLGGALQATIDTADAVVRKVAGRILGGDEPRGDTAPGPAARDERVRTPPASEDVPAARPKSGSRPAKEPRPQPKSRASNDATAPAQGDRGGQPKARVTKPRRARPGEAVSGFPEPPGKDPGNISRDPEPHHALSNPVNEPDPTEWPDPYDSRDDPRDPPDPDGQPFGKEPHVATGSMSTSEPHPSQDLEAGERPTAPERDRLDE
jgi:hypothetical protein